MFLGPRIDVWKEPGRACRVLSCGRDAFYRVTTAPIRRADHHAPESRSYFYCPQHALKWAENNAMQLPKVK